MRPSELATAILAHVAIKRPAFVWGGAGIGKSSIFLQVAMAEREKRVRAQIAATRAQTPVSESEIAKLLNAPAIDGTYFGFCDFRMVYRDAVDMLGLPYIENGCTRYALPAGLPHDPKWSGIILCDEWNSAVQQTQTVGYQLFNDRCVGEYHLPNGACLFAAGNRVSDRGVAHRVPDPLLNRWTNLYLEHDVNDWTIWAQAHGVRSDVIGFVRFRSQLLVHHDTARECHAFATPRSYEAVSKIRDLKLPREIESALIVGNVGDHVAAEMIPYFKLIDEMVSPDAILVNPTSAPVPTNAGVLYALSEALARRATLKTWGAVMEYAKRMPKEYAQCLVSSATRITATLQNTPEFIAWAAANT